MDERAGDAKILATAHRDMCTKRNCIAVCREASPLYWAKALGMGKRTETRPMPKPTGKTKLLGALQETAAEAERANRRIDDALTLLETFDGDPGDLKRRLAEILRTT